MFVTRYGGGSFSFSRLIKYVTESFTTELELKEVSYSYTNSPSKAFSFGENFWLSKFCEK